jgi:hypothetical protein
MTQETNISFRILLKTVSRGNLLKSEELHVLPIQEKPKPKHKYQIT